MAFLPPPPIPDTTIPDSRELVPYEEAYAALDRALPHAELAEASAIQCVLLQILNYVNAGVSSDIVTTAGLTTRRSRVLVGVVPAGSPTGWYYDYGGGVTPEATPRLTKSQIAPRGFSVWMSEADSTQARKCARCNATDKVLARLTCERIEQLKTSVSVLHPLLHVSRRIRTLPHPRTSTFQARGLTGNARWTCEGLKTSTSASNPNVYRRGVYWAHSCLFPPAF
jgi:hypothetical protein